MVLSTHRFPEPCGGFDAGREQMFCYPARLDGQVGFAMHAVSQGRSGRNICSS